MIMLKRQVKVRAPTQPHQGQSSISVVTADQSESVVDPGPRIHNESHIQSEGQNPMDQSDGNLKFSQDTYQLKNSLPLSNMDASGYQTFTDDELSGSQRSRRGGRKGPIINKRENDGKACCKGGDCAIF